MVFSNISKIFHSQMEGFVPLASQLAEVAAQEKLMLEQCHDLLRTISELEVQRLCVHELLRPAFVFF